MGTIGAPHGPLRAGATRALRASAAAWSLGSSVVRRHSGGHERAAIATGGVDDRTCWRLFAASAWGPAHFLRYPRTTCATPGAERIAGTDQLDLGSLMTRQVRYSDSGVLAGDW